MRRYTTPTHSLVIEGVDLTDMDVFVTYEQSGYTYTIASVAQDHAIVVSTGGSGPSLYVKDGSTWVQVTTAYRKVSGTWQQVALDQAFTAGTNYRRDT